MITDKEIIDLALAGGESKNKAWACLVEKYQARLLIYLGKNLELPEYEALPIIHESTQALVDKLETGLVIRSLPSYLTMICRNKGIDNLKEKAKNKKKFLDYQDDQWLDNEIEIQEALELPFHKFDLYSEDDTNKKLEQKVVSMLSEKCQKLLRLVYIEGKSYKEIAKMDINISKSQPDSIRKTVRRCMEKARKLKKRRMRKKGRN